MDHRGWAGMVHAEKLIMSCKSSVIQQWEREEAACPSLVCLFRPGGVPPAEVELRLLNVLHDDPFPERIDFDVFG